MTEHKQPWPVGTPCWADLVASDLGCTPEFYRAVLGWSFTAVEPGAGDGCHAVVDGRAVAGLAPTP